MRCQCGRSSLSNERGCDGLRFFVVYDGARSRDRQRDRRRPDLRGPAADRRPRDRSDLRVRVARALDPRGVPDPDAAVRDRAGAGRGRAPQPRIAPARGGGGGRRDLVSQRSPDRARRRGAHRHDRPAHPPHRAAGDRDPRGLTDRPPQVRAREPGDPPRARRPDRAR